MRLSGNRNSAALLPSPLSYGGCQRCVFSGLLEHRLDLLFSHPVLLLVAAAAAWVVVERLLNALRGIAHSVATGAEQVASASAQISSASQSLAQASSVRAASLEQSSASTEEMNATAQRNKESARQAAAVVTHSGELFVASNRALDEMVASMGEIAASSEKISRIIKVIDEIAFQTRRRPTKPRR